MLCAIWPLATSCLRPYDGSTDGNSPSAATRDKLPLSALRSAHVAATNPVVLAPTTCQWAALAAAMMFIGRFTLVHYTLGCLEMGSQFSFAVPPAR